MQKYRVVIFLLIFTLFQINLAFSDSLEVLSPNYFEEQKNVYEDIHFLKNELLSFIFCSETEPSNVVATISCNNENKEIDILKHLGKKNCYYSNYDLAQTSCQDFSLDISYKVNNKEKKIRRNFVEQIESKLINHVLTSDIDTLEPLDLSYYLTVLSEVETINGQNTQEAYEKLKNIRDNGNKCWPKSNCDISKTTEILTNVKISGYELDTRILDDGKTYLQKKTISNNNTPLGFLIDIDDPMFDSNSTSATCTITIDGDEDEYEFDEDNLDYESDVSETIIFSCNETIEIIEFNLFDLSGKVADIVELVNKTGFTYNVEDFSCLGESRVCSYVDTINSLITYGNNIDFSSELITYVENQIDSSNSEVYIDSSDTYRDTGKYLYFKNNNDLKDYLKFKQNNDGSWGSQKNSDKIEKTVWSILGLERIESNSEYVRDGKKWIYYNEPTTGWGDIKKNSLAYLAIKEQIKPYVKISAKNKIEGVELFTIKNPTIFELRDLQIELDKEIIENVLFLENIGDIGSEETLTFNLSVSSNLAAAKTGLMTITGVNSKGKRVDLVKLPITIDGNFNIEYVKEDYVVSQEDDSIKIKTVIPSGYNAACEVVDPFTTLKTPVLLSSANPNIVFRNVNLDEGEFETVLNCKVGEQNVELDIKFSVTVVKKILQTSVEEIVMDRYKDVQFEILSLSDEDLKLNLEVTDAYGGILIPVDDEVITLKARESKKLKFIMGDTTFLELVGEGVKGSIKLSTKEGYVKEVPIVREATGANDNLNLEEKEGKSFWYWAIIMVVTVIISFLGLVLYRYRQLQLEKENETDADHEDDENIF